jgi:hypothetical protein
MCGKALSKELVGMYESSLQSLGYPALCKAIEEIILSRGDRDAFPSIKTIREKILPAETRNLTQLMRQIELGKRSLNLVTTTN